jgi:S-adenosylmethionine:tRNA ribosyltransferase-isomerase
MDRLGEKSIDPHYVTLHVGAGTFRQVTADTIGGHEMHQEHIHVELDTIKALAGSEERKLIAVGTTAARTLESLYWIGVQLIHGEELLPGSLSQWYPYQPELPGNIGKREALKALICRLEAEGLNAYKGETRLIIVPGYRFRMIHGMVTNFHVPRSTLLLLVAAMLGDQWKEAYQYAVENRFRFLSYGDACLFFKPSGFS